MWIEVSDVISIYPEEEVDRENKISKIITRQRNYGTIVNQRLNNFTQVNTQVCIIVLLT
jgi:hypothetical protein